MEEVIKPLIVDSLSESIGSIWQNLQNKAKEEFYVASPLSSTPIPIYQWIIDHAEEFENWDKVRFILMDELVEWRNSKYEYISPDDPASYVRFAKEKLLNPLHQKIPAFKNEVLKPDLNTIHQFNVPLDLLILALGIKGNYANVMPRTPLERGWHITQLLPEYITYHTQNAFEGTTFRDHGMSLGYKQVLSAKNIIVIISGEKKRALTKQLLSYKEFTPEFPLSIIYHPKVKDKVQIFLTQGVL